MNAGCGGLSYSGSVSAQLGDNALTTALTDGCFDLSDNFLVVLRDDVDGGTVYKCRWNRYLLCLHRWDFSGRQLHKLWHHRSQFSPMLLPIRLETSSDCLREIWWTFAPAGVGECWVWGTFLLRKCNRLSLETMHSLQHSPMDALISLITSSWYCVRVLN